MFYQYSPLLVDTTARHGEQFRAARGVHHWQGWDLGQGGKYCGRISDWGEHVCISCEDTTDTMLLSVCLLAMFLISQTIIMGSMMHAIVSRNHVFYRWLREVQLHVLFECSKQTLVHNASTCNMLMLGYIQLLLFIPVFKIMIV